MHSHQAYRSSDGDMRNIRRAEVMAISGSWPAPEYAIRYPD